MSIYSLVNNTPLYFARPGWIISFHLPHTSRTSSTKNHHVTGVELDRGPHRHRVPVGPVVVGREQVPGPVVDPGPALQPAVLEALLLALRERDASRVVDAHARGLLRQFLDPEVLLHHVQAILHLVDQVVLRPVRVPPEQLPVHPNVVLQERLLQALLREAELEVQLVESRADMTTKDNLGN